MWRINCTRDKLTKGRGEFHKAEVFFLMQTPHALGIRHYDTSDGMRKYLLKY